MHRLVRFLMRMLRLQLCLLAGLGFGVPEGRALSLYTNHPTVAEALTSAAEEISELAKDPLRLTPRVAVVDLVERLHRERNPVSTILEERLAQMLEERLGQQSVPFKKLEQLRAEWNSDFPGRTSQQLVEDLAGQAEADWMITGTHHQEEGFLKISLQLYELATESILWQTLLEAPVVEVETTQAETPVPAPPEPAEIMTEFKFVQPQTAEPQPQTISRASTPEPAVLSEETALLAEAVDALPEPTAESAPNFGFVAEGIDEPLEEEIEEPLAEEVTGESFAEPWQLAMIEPPQAEVRLTPEPVIPEGMRLIPGGEFMMGSSTGRADETPDHRVEVRSFLMGQHEVTNAEYARCDSCERGTGGFDTTDFDQPAVYVDWENAQAYCKSRGYRLPTEVEWEYAARSGNPGPYAFGGNPVLLGQYAWFAENTRDAGRWAAQLVGQKRPNAFELYDLHGNVLEWVADYYASDYFSHLGLPDNPTGPDAPERDDYPLRVARGGAWDGLDGAGTPEGLRSARRYAFAPWTRSFRVGLRCAADWNPPQEIFPAFGGAQ
ncbi:MAG: hypothetical protein CL911_04245 [Deltaproteobacteria bacterium]|nr:hypothetical protein [Deltaproteobacteria bacterium]